MPNPKILFLIKNIFKNWLLGFGAFLGQLDQLGQLEIRFS
jgi:hypothetical protein